MSNPAFRLTTADWTFDNLADRIAEGYVWLFSVDGEGIGAHPAFRAAAEATGAEDPDEPFGEERGEAVAYLQAAGWITEEATHDGFDSVYIVGKLAAADQPVTPIRTVRATYVTVGRSRGKTSPLAGDIITIYACAATPGQWIAMADDYCLGCAERTASDIVREEVSEEAWEASSTGEYLPDSDTAEAEYRRLSESMDRRDRELLAPEVGRVLDACLIDEAAHDFTERLAAGEEVGEPVDEVLGGEARVFARTMDWPVPKSDDETDDA